MHRWTCSGARLKYRANVLMANVELGMTVTEARANAGDALRYRWLVAYLIGPRTDLDDAIVAAKTKDEHDAILDADMMATDCIPNNGLGVAVPPAPTFGDKA